MDACLAYMHFNKKSPESDRQGGCEAMGVVHIRKYIFSNEKQSFGIHNN